MHGLAVYNESQKFYKKCCVFYKPCVKIRWIKSLSVFHTDKEKFQGKKEKIMTVIREKEHKSLLCYIKKWAGSIRCNQSAREIEKRKGK